MFSFSVFDAVDLIITLTIFYYFIASISLQITRHHRLPLSPTRSETGQLGFSHCIVIYLPIVVVVVVAVDCLQTIRRIRQSA